MTRVLLIRHAQSQWNEAGKYQGFSDIALSEKGRLQAKLLRDRLKNTKIHAFYSSDLSRALETAAIVAEPHGLPVNPVPELRELNFGLWEGLTYEEILDNYQSICEQWCLKPGSVAVPQGESFEKLKARAYKALTNLVHNHQEETILVVSHGGTVRSIICAVLDLELDCIWRLRQDNAALNIIDFYENAAIITLLNDCHHLE